MTATRDIMTPQPECVATDDSLALAARQMARLGVGALPICGPDRRLKGVLTDRDIVVRALADGKDLDHTWAGSLNQGEAVTAGADDSVDDAFQTMVRHGVRRLPVIDGQTLVGMLTAADAARALSSPDSSQLIATLSAD